MLPDAPRAEIADRIRRVAARLGASLPTTVPDEWPPGFSTIAPVLLARIAGQGRTTATLIGRRHELDAQMVMRSMLEHLTLVAWLAIEPAATASGDAASHRTRDQKTRWWVADQGRQDQRHQEQWHLLIRELDDDAWAEIKRFKDEMQEEVAWGLPPKVEPMAKEVDAAWGGRLAGWASVQPREPAMLFTVQGMYRTLYTAGSRSTHPGVGQLMRTFLERDAELGAERRVRLVAEPVVDRVAPIVSIVAYLMLYAAAVAEHLYGGAVLDDSLRELDRFDVVRGPSLLLNEVAELLEGGPTRRLGTAGAMPVSVEKQGATTTVVLITSSGWERIVHAPGPVWTYDDSRGATVRAGRLDIDEAVARHIASFRTRLATADWERERSEWPDDAP